jgi:hypothetical protein
LQVFHVCESGRRQSSFLCPKGTIFNQKHRVCDWWYNVKCEDSTEFYDLNLDLLLLENKRPQLSVPSAIDPFGFLGNSLGNSLLDGLESRASSSSSFLSGSRSPLLQSGLLGPALGGIDLLSLLSRRGGGMMAGRRSDDVDNSGDSYSQEDRVQFDLSAPLTARPTSSSQSIFTDSDVNYSDPMPDDNDDYEYGSNSADDGVNYSDPMPDDSDDYEYGSNSADDGDINDMTLKLTGNLQKDFDSLTTSLAKHLKQTGNKNFDDVDIRDLLHSGGDLPPSVKKYTTTTTTLTPPPSTRRNGDSKSGVIGGGGGGGGIKFDRFLKFSAGAKGSAKGRTKASTEMTSKQSSWQGQSKEDAGSRRSDSGGSGREAADTSVTLCKLMNICDFPKNSNKRPRSYFGDTRGMGSVPHRTVVEPPATITRRENFRTGEKTALEVAMLLRGESIEDIERSATTEMEFAAGETIERDESSENDTNPSFLIKNSPVMPMSSIRFEPYIGSDMEASGSDMKLRRTSSSEESEVEKVGKAEEGRSPDFSVSEHNLDRDETNWHPLLFSVPLLDDDSLSSSQALSDKVGDWKPSSPITKQRD